MKRQAYAHTLDELKVIVDDLIDTGDNQVQLELNPLLLADPETHDILEKLVDLHPKSQGVKEIVSYSEDATHYHNLVPYRIDRVPEGFRVKILSPCGGEMEPWDFAMATFEDARFHAEAYIVTLKNPEKEQ